MNESGPPSIESSSTLRRSWLPLAILTVLALVLRGWGIAFGLPGKFRPDEEYLVGCALGFLGGDLNPRFFIYPSFFFYVLGGVFWLWKTLGAYFGLFGELRFEEFLGANLYAPAHFLARVVSALAGAATIPVTFLLAERVRKGSGYVAAIALTLCYVHVRESHFATTDATVGLLATCALCVLVQLPQVSGWSRYVRAGIFTGLAIGTKYPALALGFPFATAHLGALCSESHAPWKPSTILKVVIGLCAVVGSFVATTPYLFADLNVIKENFSYQSGFVSGGYSGSGFPTGVAWLFPFALRYGLGVGISILAGIGVVFGLRDLIVHRRVGGELILAAFIIPLCVVFSLSHLIYFRYLTLFAPAFVVLASVALCRLTDVLMNKQLSAQVALMAILLLSADSALRTVRTDRLLASYDTRSFALRWLEWNTPAGTALGSVTTFYYGKPQLTRGQTYVNYDVDPGSVPTVEYVVVDEYPISFFSPYLTKEQETTLTQQFDLVLDVNPFRRGRDGDGVYDLMDAFYVPIAGQDAVQAPGPRIRIYKRKFLSERSLSDVSATPRP